MSSERVVYNIARAAKHLTKPSVAPLGSSNRAIKQLKLIPIIPWAPPPSPPIPMTWTQNTGGVGGGVRVGRLRSGTRRSRDITCVCRSRERDITAGRARPALKEALPSRRPRQHNDTNPRRPRPPWGPLGTHASSSSWHEGGGGAGCYLYDPGTCLSPNTGPVYTEKPDSTQKYFNIPA